MEIESIYDRLQWSIYTNRFHRHGEDAQNLTETGTNPRCLKPMPFTISHILKCGRVELHDLSSMQRILSSPGYLIPYAHITPIRVICQRLELDQLSTKQEFLKFSRYPIRYSGLVRARRFALPSQGSQPHDLLHNLRSKALKVNCTLIF